MSSQVVEKMRSNVVVKEYSEDFPFASSYESAMEALSSLITRQKRGGRSSIGGKYGKLERMSMYLKVILIVTVYSLCNWFHPSPLLLFLFFFPPIFPCKELYCGNIFI